MAQATFAHARNVFIAVPKTPQSQAWPGFRKRIIHTGIALPSYPRTCFAARTRTMNTLMRRNSGSLLAYALLFALAVIACFASLIR